MGKKPVIQQSKQIPCFLFLFAAIVFSMPSIGQVKPGIAIISLSKEVAPLDTVHLVCTAEGTISVNDGKGNIYNKLPAASSVSFVAGGAAGVQKIILTNAQGAIVATAQFSLKAVTSIDDRGKFSSLFTILKKGMISENGKAYFEFKRNDSSYKCYVPWDLDNSNVMNGNQYFLPYGNGLTDLLKATQRNDGMIWSFVATDAGMGNADYFETAYKSIGFFKKEKDVFLVRQPVDNHSDYCYVNMFYKHWKASGNNEWMKQTIASAALALDYCFNDSIRWSKRFQLLKRPYCIDSWDFQVDDEYTPPAPVSPTMVIVPGKTKYGIFFGDNTGYYEACNQLAEMYEYIHENNKAAFYRNRGAAILKNLLQLSWNGKYFTHFIDEDSTIVRHLGVDEKSQIAQGNMYSLNRGLPAEINKAIIKTYLNLKENLPPGSPGEWYAIYPPFEKGFGKHNEKWQYMNGGIAGHAIGELARGAYQNGYEGYGSDILLRMLALGKKYQDKIFFSYTGSIPAAPAPPVFTTVDISHQANMDLWDKATDKSFAWMNTKRAGNDMRGLPVGEQLFKQIKFDVIDPTKNDRKSAVALSVLNGYPQQINIPVNGMAGAVYLLHSSSDNIPGDVAGAFTFVYADGSKAAKYIMKDKEVTNWWFSNLQTERSGVAWSGPNPVCTKVGVCWAVIDNPFPEKKIISLQFHAPLEGGIYSLLGITRADKPFYIQPKGPSYGGPDNWAAANGMAALVEGLAGVKNDGLAFDKVTISPRWSSAAVDSVNVTISLPASNGYVAYQYKNNNATKLINLYVTGSGNQLKGHVLIPQNATSVAAVTAGNKSLPYKIST
ncbi:MAG: hypothetical protein ABJC98_23870, partial [Bacteroidota bacterium]